MALQELASKTLTAHWNATKPTQFGSDPSEPVARSVTEKLSLYRTAHNQVESRVHSLEEVARPYQEFEKKTRKGIALMREVRADVLEKRQRALDDIDEKVEAAGAEYAGFVKRVAKGGVELSTNALARALIKRLEDGDAVRGEVGERLAGLLVGHQSDGLVEISREERDGARVLPTPPDDETFGSTEMVAEMEQSAKRPITRPQRVLEAALDPLAERSATPKDDDEQVAENSPVPQSARSSRKYDLEQENQALESSQELSTHMKTEDGPANRRSGRRHIPAKRQQDFVTWGEVRASQEWKRKRSS